MCFDGVSSYKASSELRREVDAEFIFPGVFLGIEILVYFIEECMFQMKEPSDI